MSDLPRFDLVVLGFRNDLARGRTIAFVRAQPGDPAGPTALDRETPLPHRLYVGVDQAAGLRLLGRLRDLGAQARLVAQASDDPAPEIAEPERPSRARTAPGLWGVVLVLLAAYVAIRSGALSAPSMLERALPPLAPAEPRLSAIGAGADPASSRLNEEAVGLNAAGDFAAASERLRAALEKEPYRQVLRDNLKIVMRNWAVEELNRGRPSAAVEIAQEGLGIEEDAGLLAVSGVAYSRLGEWKTARDDLERALELGAPEPAALVALGTTYRQLGNLEAAVEMLQRAREAGAQGDDFEATLAKLERELDAEWDFDELSSAHFRIGFEGGQDEDAARLVLAQLEDAYFFVGAKLGYFPPQHTPVVLYAGEEFHDITQAPGWTGGIYDGRIKLPVRGLRENSPLLVRTLRHEFAHVLVTLLTRNHVPVWLSEGVAIWAEEDEDGERLTWALRAVAGQHLLNLVDLEEPFMRLPEHEVSLAYAQSYLAVRSILDDYGTDSLRRLLAALGEGTSIDAAFESVLATQLGRFEADLVRGLTS
jgi:tetratricopeptide (TPR) repeat protein